MNDALLSSKKMDYCTPQDFFDKLNEEFHFVLDAAATEKSAKCNRFYTPETDGLKMPRSGTKIVLLIPARTDTSYFHDYVYGKAEIRFLRGRLRFEDDNGNRYPPAPFPSMLVIYNGEHYA